MLHAIADPTRRRILQALKERGACSIGKDVGLCASDIEPRVHLSQPTISHHMSILTKAGLVEAKKLGQWRWYRRNESALGDLPAPCARVSSIEGSFACTTNPWVPHSFRVLCGKGGKQGSASRRRRTPEREDPRKKPSNQNFLTPAHLPRFPFWHNPTLFPTIPLT